MTCLLLSGCSDPGTGENLCSWTQFGRDAQHHGAGCGVAQPPERRLAEVVLDPFASEESSLEDGSLRIHYQSPLVVEDDVYVGVKSGQYTPCVNGQGQPVPCSPEAYATQTWSEAHYRWQSGELRHQWTFDSDWKPLPFLRTEQLFHAAIHGGWLYVPGLGGTLHRVDRKTGQALERINPFGGEIDPTLHMAGPPSVDADGNVYYNVLQVDPGDPSRADAHGWLVRVSPSGSTRKISYAELVPQAPAADSLCYTTFPAGTPAPLPPPPNADGSPALPPQAPCFSQRPALNLAPAISPEGIVFTVSRAHRNDRYGYLIAVNPDLTPRWSSSLRDRLQDGCGQKSNCREGATPGVEPATNLPPAGRVADSATSSPVVLPDGRIAYGAFTDYNGSRGHLLVFSREGAFAGSYDFGWDITPAVYRHGSTYSLIVKDNHYALLPRDERFYITRLSPELTPEWKAKAVFDERCVRDDAGEISCQHEPGNSFEWCINAPAVDAEGTVHVASEDGHLYAIDQQGIVKGRLFLQRALRSAYTPVVLDGQGRIYAQNVGRLVVVGR